MKSILGTSLVLHAMVIAAALAVAAHRGILHVSAAEHAVLELRLSKAPRLQHVVKNAGPAQQADAALPPHPQLQSAQHDSALEATTPVAPSTLANEEGVASSATLPLRAAIATEPAVRSGNAAGEGKPRETAKTDALPWIVSSVPPEYPREARRKGWTGRVGLHVLISEQGTVQQVAITSSSGHAELDEAAEDKLSARREDSARRTESCHALERTRA